MIIRIIHNPTNHQRYHHLQKELENQVIPAGITSRFIDADMDAGKACSGISRSFKRCIKEAQDAGEKFCWILEDDVLFLTKDAIQFLWKLYRCIPNNALFLGGLYDGIITPEIRYIAKVSDKLSGLHCVIIPEKLYDTVLQADEAANLDWWLSTVAKVPMYVAYPFLAIQRDGYSDNVKQYTNYNEFLHKRFWLSGYDPPLNYIKL